MITSFKRLFLALLIGGGFLFSGSILMPQPAAAQEKVAPEKKTNKTAGKKQKKSKKAPKKSNKEQTPAQKG